MFNGEIIFRGQVLKSTSELVIFIDMNTYIITKGKKFKTFLKKIMQSLWTVVTYLRKNNEHGIEHVPLISACGVCIHQTLLKFTVESMKTLQDKQMINHNSPLVCYIVFRGSQQILLNKFCALGIKQPTSLPTHPILN